MSKPVKSRSMRSRTGVPRWQTKNQSLLSRSLSPFLCTSQPCFCWHQRRWTHSPLLKILHRLCGKSQNFAWSISLYNLGPASPPSSIPSPCPPAAPYLATWHKANTPSPDRVPFMLFLLRSSSPFCLLSAYWHAYSPSAALLQHHPIGGEWKYPKCK